MTMLSRIQTVAQIAVAASVAAATAVTGPASASDGHGCWTAPEPKSLVEAGHMSDNHAQYGARRAAVQRTRKPAALILSDGALRTAYAAGILVGWSETGRRPDFDIVTAVGPSALMAPFAFLGAAGDQHIADLFACPSGNWRATADRATAMMSAKLLASIAAKHRSGKRLLVAVKGNAARPSAYWDIGWIAAHLRPVEARQQIGSVFRAAVELSAFPDTGVLPAAAGSRLTRNRAFREIGAGRAFLMPANLRASIRSLYVIHSDVLLPDESASFLAKSATRAPTGTSSLRTIYDVKSMVDQLGKHYRIAMVAPRKWFFPKGIFDPAYMKDVFIRAHRSARMSKLWKAGSKR